MGNSTADDSPLKRRLSFLLPIVLLVFSTSFVAPPSPSSSSLSSLVLQYLHGTNEEQQRVNSLSQSTIDIGAMLAPSTCPTPSWNAEVTKILEGLLNDSPKAGNVCSSGLHTSLHESTSVICQNDKRPVATTTDSTTKRTTKYFVYKHPFSLLEKNRPIPFQDEWLHDFNVSVKTSNLNFTLPKPPIELPVPNFLDFLELQPQQTTTSLQEMGRETREWIDELLPKGSGAMLFRNLNQRIQNASDFATFWSHVIQHNATCCTNDNNWIPMQDHLSCYNRKRQRLAKGQVWVDQVDTDVPSFTIGPHNEHSCNPFPSHKIFFYVLRSATKGGESLLRRNSDIYVPRRAWDVLLAANGTVFERTYPPESVLQQRRRHRGQDYHPTEMSWQERSQAQDPDGARRYFAKHHGISNTSFFHPRSNDNIDKSDTKDQFLKATNILPGYLTPWSSTRKDNHSVNVDVVGDINKTNKLVWFNRIDYGFPVTMTNGQAFPLDLQAFLKRQKWHETSALKLEPGDWLVLDNRRVQHGRLPYQDSPEAPPRQLLVTYTT